MQTLPYGSKMLLCIPSLRERRKRLPRVLTAVFPQDPPSCVGDRQLFVRPRQSPRHAKPHGLVASAPAKRSTVGCGAARRKSKQEGSQKDWAEDRGVMRCPICEALFKREEKAGAVKAAPMASVQMGEGFHPAFAGLLPTHGGLPFLPCQGQAPLSSSSLLAGRQTLRVTVMGCWAL